MEQKKDAVDARRWSEGPLDRRGNGAAMRVLSHAARSRQFEDVRHRVLADGAASHGDPIALVRAQLFAYVLWWMLHRTAPFGWGELLDDAIHHVDLWAQFESDTVPDQWSSNPPALQKILWLLVYFLLFFALVFCCARWTP
jgi:ADP-ribosylglycohydrolase